MESRPQKFLISSWKSKLRKGLRAFLFSSSVDTSRHHQALLKASESQGKDAMDLPRMNMSWVTPTYVMHTCPAHSPQLLILMSTIYNRHASHTPHTTDTEHKLCSTVTTAAQNTLNTHTHVHATPTLHEYASCINMYYIHTTYSPTYTTFPNTHRYTCISQTHPIF